MTARTAPLLIILVLAGLGACAPSATRMDSDRVERGTALPPPGLAAPGRP